MSILSQLSIKNQKKSTSSLIKSLSKRGEIGRTLIIERINLRFNQAFVSVLNIWLAADNVQAIFGINFIINHFP